MKTISQQLRDLDNRQLDRGHNLEIFDEGKWGGTTTEYQAFNDAGVECEVGEFLYSFIRMIKPERVLETGTHWGISASYIGFALKHNEKGALYTWEFLPENHEIAKRRFKRLELNDYVVAGFGDVAKLNKVGDGHFDFMFLDTEPQTRFKELIDNFDSLAEGGYVFIHDLHRHMHQIPNADHGFAWPYGKIPKELSNLVKDGKLRPFHFGTPRGLTMFYKPTKDDYAW